MKKIGFIILSLIFITSCNQNSSNTKYIAESYGAINSMLVVAENEYWEGAIGDAIRKTFAAPVDGLPRDEPLFTITQVSPQIFDDFVTKSRNILIVNLQKESKFEIKDNAFAKPQKVVYLEGQNEEAIINLIQENGKQAVSVLKAHEVKEKQKRMHLALNKEKNLEEAFGITMNMPSVYKTVKQEENFIWLERNVTKGTMNIIVYTLPKNSIPKDDTTIDAIIKMRDSIGEKYIPGRDPETMHMITEKAYAPYLFNSIVDNKPAIETRGMWEMKNFFMAGPFINYVVEDNLHERLVVIEGFTFAPSEEKRNFMFELDAILKSLKIKE